MPPNNQMPNLPPSAPGAPADFAVPPNQAQPQPTALGSAANPNNPTTEQNPAAASNPASTQNSLLFAEIRDNLVVMRDGTFRAVVACQSINFDLMSSREREGVEYAYQNFLNSLNHPVQILIRSQRVDIEPYLTKLATLRRDEDNMLLGVLMEDYIEYIAALSEEANIMDKSFYVVIPYFPDGDLGNLKNQAKGFFGKLLAKPASVTSIDAVSYEKAKTEIKNRVDSVIAGLFQMGIHCMQLSTTELSELYYNFYNPDTAIREPVRDFNQVTTTIYTKKGTETTTTPGVNNG